MKFILKLEELAATIGTLYFLSFYSLNLPLWLWCILFFTPDFSMIGYAFNARTGALLYNLVHHKGTAVVAIVAGHILANEAVIAAGLLLFAHASFDRILGYGLKYKTGFNDTHLGALQNPTASFKTV